MTPIDDTASDPLPATIRPSLASALLARGYKHLTPVQLEMANGRHGEADLLVSAQTGSGKTVAFGIAIASTLLGQDEHFAAASQPLGLVIAPTRELAIQVQRELDWLYAATGIVTTSCVGGMDMRKERRALEHGAHLVVGTPGRLRDHITRGGLDLSSLRAVVLDEADEMLNLGFREDLEFILGNTPQQRRTLLFAATVPRGITDLAKTYQRNALRIATTASTEQHADIDYEMTLVRRDEREHAIINTLLNSDAKSALIFCHTREAVRHLTARLANRKFSVVSLSGEMAQSERSNALQSMRDGRAQVCVATDVAARGIDLPNLDLVIHADVPSNPATLLHRSGRTGRAGRKGVCVLIVPENRRGAAQRVLSLAKLTATVRAAPGINEIEARYRREILNTALASAPPDEAETAFVTELLQQVDVERLAAAFIRQQLATRPVAEDIAPLPISERESRKPRDKKRFAEDSAAMPRGEARHLQMEDSVWFSLSVGRKHRADPKWLLPMICKAGGVAKRDVGSIKIDEAETRFEIASDKAGQFAETIRKPGSMEKGIIIRPADAGPKPKFRQHAARGKKPFGKPQRNKATPAPARPTAKPKTKSKKPKQSV